MLSQELSESTVSTLYVRLIYAAPPTNVKFTPFFLGTPVVSTPYKNLHAQSNLFDVYSQISGSSITVEL